MAKPLSYIEISKENLLHNISEFRKILPAGNKLAGVVKANAYGHGLKEVVSIIEPVVDFLQVDDIEELREVRKLSKKPILVFGYVEKDELEEAVALDGTLGVYDEERIKILNTIGVKLNKKIKIHLKVDTYLGRQGILVDEVENILKVIKESEYIELESIYSHFSNIEDTENLDHAQKQFEDLMKAKDITQKNGFPNITHHISATSGLLSDTDKNWGSSLVRLGIGMYGLWPSESLKKKFQTKIELKPVVRWVTKIAQIKNIPADYPVGYGLTFITKKPTTIAIIPQGYSDGFDRKFSNNGFVLVRGVHAAILGRIAMNMFVVDVTDIQNIQAEDEVVLLGKQGEEELTAEELAGLVETINYEIVARISPLLSRVIV